MRKKYEKPERSKRVGKHFDLNLFLRERTSQWPGSAFFAVRPWKALKVKAQTVL